MNRICPMGRNRWTSAIAAMLLVPAGTTAGASRFDVVASMPEGELTRFRTREFRVSVQVDPEQAKRYGWNGEAADTDGARGEAHPILQLELPASVELVGAPAADLTTPEDFATYFLGYPHGRRLETAVSKIAFRLIRNPRPEETIGLNLIAYLGSGTRDDTAFVRRRLELPVAPGATARLVPATRSTWGAGAVLGIGDGAVDFSLPSLSGPTVSLSSMRGQYVVLTTYRGHW